MRLFCSSPDHRVPSVWRADTFAWRALAAGLSRARSRGVARFVPLVYCTQGEFHTLSGPRPVAAMRVRLRIDPLTTPPLAGNLLDARELLAFAKGCFARPPSVPALFRSFSSRPAAHTNARARAHSHVAYNCTACQRLHVPLIFVTANDALRHGDAGLRAPRCSLGALKHLPACLAVEGRRSKLRIALDILIGARAPEWA